MHPMSASAIPGGGVLTRFVPTTWISETFHDPPLEGVVRAGATGPRSPPSVSLSAGAQLQIDSFRARGDFSPRLPDGRMPPSLPFPHVLRSLRGAEVDLDSNRLPPYFLAGPVQADSFSF